MERNTGLAGNAQRFLSLQRPQNAEAKLIHFELAGRYSHKAMSLAPFMLPCGARIAESERTMLAVSPPTPTGSAPHSRLPTKT
jgi:hypothetical protein